MEIRDEEQGERRDERQQSIAKKILWIVAGAVGIFVLVVVLMWRLDCYWLGTSALVWNFGMLGGSVSLRQRLKKAEPTEVDVLSSSWASLILVPVMGGVFAFLLYILFLSELVDSSLFPTFDSAFCHVRDDEGAKRVFAVVFGLMPDSVPNMARLMFWSFVAGFSERFVPQIVKSVTGQVTEEEIVEVSSEEIVEAPSEEAAAVAQAAAVAPPPDVLGEDDKNDGAEDDKSPPSEDDAPPSDPPGKEDGK